MMRIVFRRVRPGKVSALRAWFTELSVRANEVRETLENEGIRHECAWLLESATGPVLVYAMETDDMERARKTYRESTRAIDLQHRALLTACLEGEADVEEVLNVCLAAGHGN